METKTDRGQALLELSLFIIIIVGLVGLTVTQTKRIKADFKPSQIGKAHEKTKY